MTPSTSPPPESTTGTIVIVCFCVLAACAVFLFLYGLMGPMLFWLVLLAVTFLAFGGLHYWLWGRSMPSPDDDD